MKIFEELVGSLLMGLEIIDDGVRLITDKQLHLFHLDDYGSVEIDGEMSLFGEKILDINHKLIESYEHRNSLIYYKFSIEIIFMLKTISITLTKKTPNDEV